MEDDGSEATDEDGDRDGRDSSPPLTVEVPPN
jgi:hypothetical protein